MLLAAAGLGVSVQGQTFQLVVDPNGDSAPLEVKNLKLSFQLNTQDIVAPQILFTPDGATGFVNYLVSGQDKEHGYVVAFNPNEPDPTKQILSAIQVGLRPGPMSLSPDGTELWVVNLGNFGFNPDTYNSISVIDTASLKVKALIETPDQHYGFGSRVIFDTPRKAAYVSSTLTDEVLKIDAVNKKLVSSLKLVETNSYYYFSVGPTQLLLSHSGEFICCVNTFNETVSVIDAGTFTERYQIEFTDYPVPLGGHVANFQFTNNVILTDDDSVGLVASAGTSNSILGIPDQVYLFDPATGKKVKDSDGNDRYLPIPGDPHGIYIDPNGQFLVVHTTSYNKVDVTGYQTNGQPGFYFFTWPDLQLFKKMEYQVPDYNLTQTGQFVFVGNGDGTYDIVAPFFSTFDALLRSTQHETLVRTPMSFRTSTTGQDILGTSDKRAMPVTLAALPGPAERLFVANYLSSNVVEVWRPDQAVFSTAVNVFIETGISSALVFLNPTDAPLTFQMQAFQTNDTAISDDVTESGIPFYWVDDQKVANIISPIEMTLQPGQQWVGMVQDLSPDYAKVVNQHGFLKIVHPTERMRGLVFNGAADDTFTLTRGDYLKIGGDYYQDCIFPFLYSDGDVKTYIHYVNPFLNQTAVYRAAFFTDGTTVPNEQGDFIVGISYGVDQFQGDHPDSGYVRVFNEDNLNSEEYMTVEGKNANASFLFACPPLDPNQPSATRSFVIPYWKVGAGWDTLLELVSMSQRTDPAIVDSEGKAIPQYTHLKIDYYSVWGDLLVSKETDFLNESLYGIMISYPGMGLSYDRYSTDLWVGNAVVTVDRDDVAGVFGYVQYRTPPDTTTPEIQLIQNMTVDELPNVGSGATSFTFPYALTMGSFYTDCILYNPNADAAAKARVELYNSDGSLFAQSAADVTVPPRGNAAFSLADTQVFGEVPGLSNFMGYMKIASTNGVPFIAKALQGTPGMLALVPAL